MVIHQDKPEVLVETQEVLQELQEMEQMIRVDLTEVKAELNLRVEQEEMDKFLLLLVKQAHLVRAVMVVTLVHNIHMTAAAAAAAVIMVVEVEEPQTIKDSKVMALEEEEVHHLLAQHIPLAIHSQEAHNRVMVMHN